MEPMMCAVCRRALNRQGNHFIHPVKDGSVLHDPVPVPFGILDPRLRCDFCSADDPTKVLPARTFQTPVPEAGSMGNWACCDICAGFIERDEWAKLVDRAMATAPPEIRRLPGGRKLYTALYRSLRDNITGPIRDL